MKPTGDYKKLYPPRPQPVVLTPDMTITKCPDGKPQRHALDGKFRDAKGRAPGSGRVVPKLVKISIRCEACNRENVRLVPQLRQVCAKCQCGASLSFRWQGVKSK
jgi:hypothetical protein